MSKPTSIWVQRWKFDLNPPRVPTSKDHREQLQSPPSYTTTISKSQDEQDDRDENISLIRKRSWDIALGPIKSLPMNFFVMWMAGNTISIFPLMMVGMMAFRPIKALPSVNSVFSTVEPSLSSLWLQKFVYILGNLLGIGLALYKCQTMGFLPTHASDWLAFAEQPLRMEYAQGGLTWLK